MTTCMHQTVPLEEHFGRNMLRFNDFPHQVHLRKATAVSQQFKHATLSQHDDPYVESTGVLPHTVHLDDAPAPYLELSNPVAGPLCAVALPARLTLSEQGLGDRASLMSVVEPIILPFATSRRSSDRPCSIFPF